MLNRKASSNIFAKMGGGIIFLLVCFCAPVYAQAIKTQEQDLSCELGAVDLNAGITYGQANLIAQYYARRYIAGRGSAYPAVDKTTYWKVVPRVGTEGAPDKHPILISKYSGKISWEGGPTLNLADLLNSVDSAPRPINSNWKTQSMANHSVSSLKIEFIVLPTGDTAGISFRRSSKNLKCDLNAKRIVEDWRFPKREKPITLVADMVCSAKE